MNLNGVEFRQSATWPMLYASACGLVYKPTGTVGKGSLLKSGYYNICGSHKGEVYTIPAHRIVADAWLGPVNGLMVDHINRVRSDNRVDNMRYVSRRQNLCNQVRQVEGRTSSQYRGVCWDKGKGKWKAQIGAGGVCKQLGRFASEEDAARAYDAALHMLGLAPVNFV